MNRMPDKPGRIRQEPAPLDLAVPPYAFTANTTVKTG
jgi:Rieske Fe-S protein